MARRRRYRIALCQMSSGADPAANLAQAESMIAGARSAGARLVCLPEMLGCMSADDGVKVGAARPASARSVHEALAAAARRHRVHLAAGSYDVRGRDGKLRNRSVLFGPDGGELARYDKMHLFRFSGGRTALDETRLYSPGKRIVAVDTPLGRIGLSICFDLRFPELYRRMRGPDLILAPAAFTRTTGRAHWKLLLRARAVENQCYAIGTAQCGEHHGGLRSWGHSLLVDPWGETVAEGGEDPEVLLGEIDLGLIAEVRERLPALSSRILQGG